MARSNLSGLRVVVVEDESLVSMLIEDTLGDLGCTVVATASELGEAQTKLASAAYDVVILDVNLSGARTFGIAQRLIENGTPFVFSTGYGIDGIPEHLRNMPIISKPFSKRDIEKALVAELDAADADTLG